MTRHVGAVAAGPRVRVPRAPECRPSDEYIKGIWRSISSQKLPVEVSTESASTGLFKAAMGRSREFLVVKPVNRALDVFRVLHYGVPSGDNLAAG